MARKETGRVANPKILKYQNTVLESFYNEEFDKPDDEISSPPITRSPISSGHTPPKITSKSAETD